MIRHPFLPPLGPTGRLLQTLVVVTTVLVATPPGVSRAAVDAVTFGLPERLLGETGARPQRVERLIREHYARLPCWRRKGCVDQPQVNVVLGTDYEILDWFGKGLLDIAVVPELGTRLLRDDRLDFVDLELPHAATPSPPDSHAPAGRPLERFAEETWCGARARTQKRWDEAYTRLAGGPSGLPAVSPSCEAVPAPDRTPVLELPSHFQGFVEAVDAVAGWLSPRLGPWTCSDADRGLLEDAFWKEFFARTRFTLAGGPRLRTGAGLISTSARYSGDRLVLTKPMARRLHVRTQVGRHDAPLPAALEEMWGRACPTTAGDTVRQLPVAFRPVAQPAPGFGVRTFGFSPGESIDLLRLYSARRTRLAPEPGAEVDPPLVALVLPGGGVKAAYQTVLLQELYQAGLLRNGRPPAPGARPAPLDVSYVIGTSGGALLGYFAARLDGPGPWALDRLLWQWCSGEVCREMRSTDVFGYLDMPRYVSAVVVLIVFAVIIAIVLPRSAASPEAIRRGRRWRLLLWVVPPLLALPFVIRYVSGGAGREHIPEVEGAVYALCVIAAMIADQCVLVRVEHQADPRSRLGWVGLGLIVVGFLAVALPGLLRASVGAAWWLDQAVPLRVPPLTHPTTVHTGALVVCTGGLLAVVGLISRISQSRGYVFDGRGAVAGFGLGVLQIVLVSLAVYGVATLWPAAGVTLLELTSVYWVAIAAVSAAVAVLLLALRRLVPTASVGRFLADGFDYLANNHPNGAHAARRVVRLTLQALLAVVWWNLVLAPAMYGNGVALQFLEHADQGFRARHPRNTTLKVPLIVTANILEADGARYFAFVPESSPCLRLARRSGYGAVWRVFVQSPPPAAAAGSDAECYPPEDRRWDGGYLRDIVFASGSPYPVFPAHTVVERRPVRLVDGGYANNVPLDAAQAVGADAVLIVESSNPLGHPSLPWGWLGAIPGDLVGHLGGLFTFLWERSQELDRISRRELLVVSLAPLAEHAEWPSLVQFTPGVIDRMKQTARDDWKERRRIGMVQSWGRPHVAYSVAGVTIPGPQAAP